MGALAQRAGISSEERAEPNPERMKITKCVRRRFLQSGGAAHSRNPSPSVRTASVRRAAPKSASPVSVTEVSSFLVHPCAGNELSARHPAPPPHQRGAPERAGRRGGGGGKRPGARHPRERDARVPAEARTCLAAPPCKPRTATTRERSSTPSSRGWWSSTHPPATTKEELWARCSCGFEGDMDCTPFLKLRGEDAYVPADSHAAFRFV